MTNASEDLMFTPSKSVTRYVNDKEMQFYPLTVGMTTRIRALAKPITLALSILFQDTDKDIGRNVEEFTNIKEEMTSTKTVLTPITTEMAKFRSEQREKAMASLLDALTEKANLDALTEIIMDSLRMPTPRVVSKFQENLDIATMVELIKGVIAANKGVFGPLALKVTEAMSRMTSQPSPQGQSPASDTKVERAEERSPLPQQEEVPEARD